MRNPALWLCLAALAAGCEQPATQTEPTGDSNVGFGVLITAAAIACYVVLAQ